MATLTLERPPAVVHWPYVGYSLIALGVMVAAIMSHDRWFLNFVHVICGVMWTGIDLFMGFIVGPILKRIDMTARREVIVRLVPKTLYLLPTNLRVCLELRKPAPDVDKINRMMRAFFFAVACQGTMQVMTIVIMAKFVSGI